MRQGVSLIEAEKNARLTGDKISLKRSYRWGERHATSALPHFDRLLHG